MLARRFFILLAANFLVFAYQGAVAGKLDSFENSVSDVPEKTEKQANQHHDYCSSENSVSCPDGDDFLDIFFNIVIYGGESSFDRVTQYLNPGAPTIDETGYNIKPRKPGEPLIPFVRFDFAYQPYISDISARDYRIEIGYGPFAAAMNKTYYIERSPTDKLKIIRTYGLYRMSYGSKFELDLGIGSLLIDGESKNSYSYLTLPILIQLSDKFGIEFRPAWAANIDDYDIGLLFNSEYFLFKMGYRTLRTNSESLNGPYIGMSVRY